MPPPARSLGSIFISSTLSVRAAPSSIVEVGPGTVKMPSAAAFNGGGVAMKVDADDNKLGGGLSRELLRSDSLDGDDGRLRLIRLFHAGTELSWW